MAKSVRYPFILLIIAMALIFSACQMGNAALAETSTPEATIIPTDTPVPPTATPEPARVVWVSSLQNDETQQIAAVVQSLAENSGIQFEALSSLDSNQITDAMRVVVVHTPNYDFQAAAASHQGTQFIVITNQPMQSAANLSVIRSNVDQVLFAGGYLSVILSYDWRAAGLIVSDGPTGDAAAAAFYNGGGYFCGRCSPLSPPYMQFPLFVSLPANTDANNWEYNYQSIEENRINIVFLDGRISDPEIYNRLAQRDLVLLGSGNPPAGISDKWAATVESDVAATVERIWPDIIAGNAAGNLTAHIQLTNVNPNLVGDGIVQFFNQMTEELETGIIATENQALY